MELVICLDSHIVIPTCYDSELINTESVLTCTVNLE